MHISPLYNWAIKLPRNLSISTSPSPMSEPPNSLQLRFLTHSPDDILMEILTKLPVKHILRSKCVCKHWCSLIQDPYFFHFHSLIARKSLTALCRQCDDSNSRGNFFYSSDGLHAEFHQTLKLSFYDEFINSCNGLYCYYGVSVEKIKVCNPLTREIVVLPKPNGLREHRMCARIGLGFDSSTRKYKVVCWSGGIKQNDSTVEVLTLGNKPKLWRRTTTAMHVEAMAYCDKPVYANGNLHWDTRTWDYKKGIAECTIYSFDFRYEKVQRVSGPDVNLFNKKHWICEFQNCLGLVHRDIENKKMINMWVLTDYNKSTWVQKRILFPDSAIWEEFIVATKPWSIIKQARSVIIQKGEILVLLCEGTCWYISQYNEYGKLLKRIEIMGLPTGATPSLHYDVENFVSFRLL